MTTYSPDEELLAFTYYHEAQRRWTAQGVALSDDLTDDKLVGAFSAADLARMPAAAREWFVESGLAEGMSAAEVWQECLDEARGGLNHRCDETCECPPDERRP